MRRDADETAAGRYDADDETAGGERGGGRYRRYTVQEAALALDLSVDAVRKRADRGRLQKEKAPDGTVYIVLDAPREAGRSGREGPSATGRGEGEASGQLVESLQDQILHLRRELDARNEELRRKDQLIAMIFERIPELEVPSDPPEEHASGQEPDPKPDPKPDPEPGQEPGAAVAEANGERRSRFMRFFFGP